MAPEIPNAKYIFSHTEFEHFQAKAADMDRVSFDDSVLPIVEHGLAEMTNGSRALGEGLLVQPAPGHTPGHITLTLETGDHAAIFTGDILHHPLQILYPNWNSRFCSLPDEARKSRHRVLEFCVERNALLMPAHFGSPHCCNIARSGEAYSIRWHKN